MLIDTHCHLASHRFDPSEIESLIAHAQTAGVSQIVTLATCLDDLAANLNIAHHPAVHACIGIHPCDVHHAPDNAIEILASHTADPRVCAIGETGLDYFHPAPNGWSDDAFRNRQRSFLTQHFELAKQSQLPIVIHTRDASGHASFDDAISIYRTFYSQVRAVFHCFIGTWQQAERVLELGGVLSFGGIATFKNTHSLREVISRCPKESFMLETDAPYLAPTPHRGKRNEPAYTAFTAQAIASLRQESLSELATHTSACAHSFFRFRHS